jgi:hypothetical protein
VRLHSIIMILASHVAGKGEREPVKDFIHG